MFPAVLVLALFAPDLDRLGADSFAVRERETRRLDNPLSAALLPPVTTCPETNARIRWLKSRHRALTERDVERLVMRDDWPRWVAQYLALGRSQFARDYEFYLYEFLNRPEHYGLVFAQLPLPPDRQWNFWQGALLPRDYPAYLDYLDYHQGIAPAPREK